MPMQSGVPDLVRHAVVAIAKQYGGDTDKAFAIAVAQMQKSGYLEKGSMKLTAAGKKKEKEHESDPDFKSKMAEYEKLLKANRKEESIRGYKFPFYAHNEREGMWFLATSQLKNGNFKGAILDGGAAGRSKSKAKKSSLDSQWSGWDEIDAEKVPENIKAALDAVNESEEYEMGFHEAKSEAKAAAKKMSNLVAKMTRGEIDAEEFGAMQSKIVKAAKEGGYEKEMYSHIDAKSQKEMQRAMKSAKAESFSYKQEAEWDASFYERLVNPTAKTGLEHVPHTVARRWDAVREEESDMTFMRRLAGVGQRYTDRTLDEGAAVDKLLGGSVFRKGDKVEIWDGQDRIAMGSFVKYVADDFLPAAQVEVEKVFVRTSYYKVGETGTFSKTMLRAAKKGVKESVLSVTDRLRALLSEEADEPEEHYFKNEDGGMFVLKKLGNKFMVATAGVTADDAMADLYTRAVRKAASMSDAIKIIKKMVR